MRPGRGPRRRSAGFPRRGRRATARAGPRAGRQSLGGARRSRRRRPAARRAPAAAAGSPGWATRTATAAPAIAGGGPRRPAGRTCAAPPAGPADIFTEQDAANGGQGEPSHLVVQVDRAGWPRPPLPHDLLDLPGHGRGIAIHPLGANSGCRKRFCRCHWTSCVVSSPSPNALRSSL